MEENPSRNRDGSTTRTKKVKTCAVDRRYGDGNDEDPMKCSGNFCKSCTAGLIADCVALCCCPCAVVNFLALAFVKVPYMIGRKCLGLGKKKSRKKIESQRKCRKSFSSSSDYGGAGSGGGGEFFTTADDGMLEMILKGSDEIGGGAGGNARSEAERVWLELYQVGQLGFGRISFTGVNHQIST